MIRKNAIANIIPLSPHKSDKVTRTYSIQARLRLGSVRFNKDLEYYSDLEDQLCQFPRSKHDDMVDGMSYLGLLLDYFVESNTQEQIDEDEANEEFEEYEQQQGRNEITGY
jgi:phage terminase large subunit-like protein